MIRLRCAALMLLPVLLLSYCARGIRETETGPAEAKKKILVAALSSEYKDRIAHGLVDRYKNTARVTLMPIEKLNSADYRNYDALVVIDALMAWQMFNARTRWFIGKVKEPEELKKLVLFFTAGKPKQTYTVMGVDCVTGASVMGEEDEVVKKLSERIDRLLK